jgi:hypothetical protein
MSKSMTGKKTGKGGAGSMPSMYASGAGATGGRTRRPQMGPAQEKLASIRQSLEGGSALKETERVRAIAQLPPHEHIISLVRGLDRDPHLTPPWTGDSKDAWLMDPEKCIRRFTSKMESRMRASVTHVVETENRASLSPAWRERDFLNTVFQRVDKERHGKLTGDCDLSMFMQAWGNAPVPPPSSATATVPVTKSTMISVEDDIEEEAIIEHDEDVHDSGTGAAPEVSQSPRKKIGKKQIGSAPINDSKLLPKIAESQRVSQSTAGLSLSQRLERRRENTKFASIALLPDATSDATSASGVVTQAAAAAIFVKYGYDRDGEFIFIIIRAIRLTDGMFCLQGTCRTMFSSTRC